MCGNIYCKDQGLYHRANETKLNNLLPFLYHILHLCYINTRLEILILIDKLSNLWSVFMCGYIYIYTTTTTRVLLARCQGWKNLLIIESG